MTVNKFFIIMVASVMIASISQIFLKKSALKEHDSMIKEYLNLEVIVGYGLLVVSTIATIIAFSGMDYKNGPIIESLGYIFIMILSKIFLGEKITKRKLIGNICILLGIFIYYI